MNQAETKRFRTLISYFKREMSVQRANRFQMAVDEDYYDNMQWEPGQAQIVLSRGQFPVAWNEVKPTIDWLIGTERRTRVDYKIIARNEKSDEADKDAQIKTKFLKYLEDVNRTPAERSQAFDDSIKAGLGWIEIGVRSDPEDEPIYARTESWRNMLYDSLGSRRDLEDARYIFRYKSVDLDIAKAYFPGKEAILERSTFGSDDQRYAEWYQGRRLEDYQQSTIVLPDRWQQFDPAAWLNNPRERVMLIEAWYREPSTRSTDMGAGTYDRSYMRMRCAVMTEEELLYDMWSPYKHNKFPFVPVWCYRRKRDNAPYGAIRAIRGQQDIVNKAMSKAVWTASANQMVAEADAFDKKIMTVDEAREELASPDGAIILAQGGLAKFKKIDGMALSDGFMRLSEYAVNSLRGSAGVNGDNRGLETNAISGKAVIAKQEQGGLVTAEIFDNGLLARQMEGELELSLAEQYMTEPMAFPVMGERSKYEFQEINQPDPETGQVMNDITARQARFVIGEQAWRQSLMQATFESMMDLMGKIASIAPQVVTAMITGVLELAEIPNKAAMLKQVRQALGEQDPDSEPTPEEQQQQARAKAIKDGTAQGELDLLLAKVKEAQSRGDKISSESLQLMMEAFKQAIEGAQIVAVTPGTAAVADKILQAGNYQPKQGADPNIPQAVAPTQQAPVVPPDQRMIA